MIIYQKVDFRVKKIGLKFKGGDAFKLKKRALLYNRGMPFVLGIGKLDHSDIYSGRAFLALLDVKSDAVAFFERFKTGCIDC